MEKKLPGVYQIRKADGSISYRSSVTCGGKHISLGSYSSPEKASRAYQEAVHIWNEENPERHRFYKNRAIPFEKEIVLLNYRLNKIYMATPILMHKRYFSYYLSRSDVLLFDMDDLFYFSSHRIMRRGGHLFADDFGSQISILSRFGIPPYAVAGKDYQFVNGDPQDYRYQNLKVINPYFGVHEIIKKGKIRYQVTIHEKSTLLVGEYENLLTGAIAYNKAADILKKNGCTKNFQSNYIDGVSPKDYAEIYSGIKIRKSIFSRHYDSE